MKKPSIIIPYYNGGHYIGNLLEDLIQQDFKEEDYEIIVVDDGSTEPVEVLESYCERYPQIMYVRQDNQGVSVARNRGISMATGEYLYFCDCDDRVRHHALSHICELAASNGLEVLFFNFITLSEGEKLLGRNYSDILNSDIMSGVDYFAKNPKMRFHPFHYILSKKFVEDYHLRFPSGVIYHEDEAFLIDVLFSAKKVSYCNRDVYFYVSRPHAGARYYASVLRAWKSANDRIWLLKKYHQLLSDYPEISCCDGLRQRKGLISFQLLSHAFRYCTVRQNLQLVNQLRSFNAYPFEEGRYISRLCHIAYQMMQIYPLWITCCAIYHILPDSIRKKH